MEEQRTKKSHELLKNKVKGLAILYIKTFLKDIVMKRVYTAQKTNKTKLKVQK